MKNTQMNFSIAAVTAAVAVFTTVASPAATNYVWQGSPSPGPPYADWSTAAHTIQDAVDVAQAGDTVLVTNGVYATGGRSVGTSLLVNRVAIDKPITLLSVNGPEVTIIEGAKAPGGTNGDGAIRCVYLADAATLSGFTLTNGATRDWNGWDDDRLGGGVWSALINAAVTNCTLTGNSADYYGGGAHYATLVNCTLTGNSARVYGGGASSSMLNNCTLSGNSASDGGGAIGCALNNCTLSGNSAFDEGGGAQGGTLSNCTLTGNSARYGGGASSATLNNCTLTGNWASYEGGGAYGSTLSNCTLTGNSADYGGGACSGPLNNCIVYYNRARLSGPNCYDCYNVNYCCTTPLPVPPWPWQEPFVGNLDLDPQLASAWRLSVFSPCRAAGSAAYATGTDIDGEPWANPPSIGCDEYRAGAVTGPLTLSIQAAYTNVAVGVPVELTAWIEGRPTLSVWDFDDGDFALDQPWTTHAWTAPGDYVVALWAFNETHPEGVNTTLTVHVLSQPVHYVAASSGNPLPPYLSWATAATDIQDAVDAAVPGALVLVSNGVYATGGRAVDGLMTNRVAIDKPVRVESVNGPEVTLIRGCQVPGTTNGDGAIRCVYLGGGAVLRGFTLTNGATRGTGRANELGGGGVWCSATDAVVTNCILTGNSAGSSGGGANGGTLDNCTLSGNSAYDGGGAYGGTISNCTLTANSASYAGGGANYATLVNCTLTGNSASSGGGACGGTLKNCILTGNSAFGGGGACGSDLGDGYLPCALDDCILSGNSASTGGGAFAGTLNNCTLTANSAGQYGGGAAACTLNNCALTGNSATKGGGAEGGTLNNCTLTGNSAWFGGGTALSTVRNCALTRNSATEGGGACESALYNCTLTGNSAAQYGGGAAGGTLTNCRLTDNAAAFGGGAAPFSDGGWPVPWYPCTLYNCTLAGNSATQAAGGVYTGTWDSGTAFFNCIICDNTAPDGPNYAGRQLAFAYSCTTPLPPGPGNIDANPLFINPTVGDFRLRLGSPCIDAGTNLSDIIITNDLTGNPRPLDGNGDGLAAFDMGAYEFVPPARYVWQDSPSPGPPYATWAAAAHTIQDAVDAAQPGDTVLVTNGVYATGGRAVGTALLVNRVAIDKPITVFSVNGPEVTIIEGAKAPGGTNGDGAIRCVYLGNGARLSGFTLTNGATRDWNGGWDDLAGGGVWSASTNAVVTNCVLTSNSAYLEGGGTFRGTLNNCILTGNSAYYGGGAYSGTLNNCTLSGNLAADSGGGAYYSTLNNCTLTGNSAVCSGGGVAASTLFGCTLAGNSALAGGGAGVSNEGIEGFPSTLYHCTLTGNSATRWGGGGVYCRFYNSIVYDNTAPDGPNYSGVTVAYYSCTTPLPPGEGNIDADPQLLPDLHLPAASPCIGAGSWAYTQGVDIDGEPWFDPPCMGADQYYPTNFGGPLAVRIVANRTFTGPGWPIEFRALIQGRPTAYAWNFGDGTVMSNRFRVSYAWPLPGTYAVSLTAWNDTYPSGVTATTLVQVLERVHCVDASSPSPQSPYTNWATAARTIQEAIDATEPGGWVLVTNGVYASGGPRGNRVALSGPIVVRSVNGPTATVIQGNNAVRCAQVGNQAVLSGFTLTNGRASYGGGVWSEGGIVTNCVLRGNSAENGAGAYGGTLYHCRLLSNAALADGGGALESTLHNCVLAGNAATTIGGGVSGGILHNCTVVGNSAGSGGGAAWSTLYNCVVYDNTAPDEPNHSSSTFAYSCTTPLPGGIGNIEGDPAFVNPAAGDFRLRFGSPCIDAGTNLSACLTTDLAGLPRPLDGTGDGVAAFDMGAYEFDLRATISQSWFFRYGLDPDNPNILAADPDRDGHSTFQEWEADTDPTNAASVLRIVAIFPGPPVSVSVPSSAARLYTLQSCTDPSTGLWTPVSGQTDIPGTGGPLTLSDPNASPSRFYRVSVRVP